MKKFTAIAAFVLTMALVLCSFLMPAATTATGSGSNWTASSGSTIESESSEIWVVDTVTVTYSAAGWVQHKEQMTDLIGKNGLDGKGYINVIFGDGSVAQSRDAGYAHFQLVGKADPTIEIPYRTVCDKAIDWAFRGDGTNSGSSALVNGRIANTQENDARNYGAHETIAAEGYRVVFTRDADNYVMVRGIGNGVFGSALEYTGNIKSSKKLTEIPGDNGETAADGVYYRLYSHTARTITTTIAYPMPDDFDANTSRWVVGGGAAIANQSVEYLKVDYVDVTLSKTQGFIQHKALLTDFFGANGKDGKGFINVKAFDGDAALTEAKSYYYMQFVGKSDASAWIAPDASVNALSWYNYSQAGYDYAGLYRNKNTTPFKQYGTSSKFAAGGQQFVFTKDADGHVMPRGNGVGITNDFQSYTTTSALKSDNTLSQIVGDGSKTGADGVYFRFASNVSSVNLEAQLTIAYPCEAPVASTPTETPTATPTATPIPNGVNLVPEDLFASKSNMQQWFGGTISDTTADFFQEDGEYVYKAPKGVSSWPYTIQELPDGSFTVKMEIKPNVYDSSGTNKYSGMGVLLGYGNTNSFPWMNIRFDADYANKKMMFYIWEHDGTATPATQKYYGTDWYAGEFPEDMWFEVIMEFTSAGTKIYLDGYETPLFTDDHTPGNRSLGHFPTADELKYIGFFPSGDVNYIKNFEVYKGVGLQLGALAPAATPTPGAPSATPGAQNKPTGDSSMMLIVMAIALCAGGAIVLSKKRGFAK